MATQQPSDNSAVRQILKETIEVQLAGLRAGMAFWKEWIDNSSKFVEAASKGMLDINEDPKSSDKVLSELSDAGRVYMRKLSELPLVATEAFKNELSTIAKERNKKPTSETPKSKRTRTAKAKN